MVEPIPEAEAVVRRVAVFRGATDDDVRRIASLGIRRAVEEGAYFFWQGEPAGYLYILVSGRAKLTTLSVDGQQVNLRTLVPNQLFGAVGAIDPEAVYPASALALEDSTALAIERGAFARLLTERPHLAFGMMRLMTGYIQEMQERYRELATERVEQRIARALLRLAAQSGRRLEQAGIDLPFSRQDVAEMTGTTLYTVSRVLSSWEKKGLIAARREHVTLLQPHALVQIADDVK